MVNETIEHFPLFYHILAWTFLILELIFIYNLMRSSIKGVIFYLQSVQASKVDRIYLVLHIVFLSDYLSWGFLNYGCKIEDTYHFLSYGDVD
jgi:hypothetical protein